MPANQYEVSTVFNAIDKMTAPIRRISAGIDRMTSRATAGLRRVTQVSGGAVAGLKKMGQAAAVAGAVAVAGLGTAAASGIEFEQSLVNAGAKFPGMVKRGSESFDTLSKAAQKVGATTEFSATQAAQALDFLAMAGFSVEQSVGALPGVVNLATAGNLDLATATDIASDALGAFNLTSKDAATQAANLSRINDVLAKTANSSNTNIQTMFEAIKEGAPVATSAGASIETFNALLGTLANSGIKGGQAGTVLKNMFVRLQAPTGEAAKVIRRLGIQLQTADGRMRDAVEIIGEVNRKTANLTKTQRAAALQAVFGMEAIAGVNVLMNAGEKQIDAYRKELENTDGVIGEMAATMRDTTRGSLNSLNSAIEGVSITLFSMTRGPLKDAIDLATEWVRANGDMLALNIGEFFLSLAQNIDTVVTTLKWLGGGVAAVWALHGALTAVSVIMAAVNLVMAANPIGLAVLAVAGLVAAALTLTDSWGQVPAFFENMWADVVQIFTRPIDFLTAALNQFVGFFSSTINAAASGVRSIGESLGIIDAPAATAAAGGVVSPQERTATLIEEKRQTSSTEITLRDETGRAEVTRTRGRSAELTIVNTGDL